MRTLIKLLIFFTLTISVSCNNKANPIRTIFDDIAGLFSKESHVDVDVVDIEENFQELQNECKSNGDTIIGLFNDDLFAVFIHGPANNCEYDSEFYNYDKTQEVYLYDLATKEKKFLFASHKNVLQKEGYNKIYESKLDNFSFPKLIEDKNGAALLLWEGDWQLYLFPLNENNYENKYLYPVLSNNEKIHKTADIFEWYENGWLKADENQGPRIGYYRLYDMNSQGNIIWTEDSVKIYRDVGESPLGGDVFATAPASILNDMDDFKSKVSSFLRGYPEYGNASMGVKYLLEVTYSSSLYFCSSEDIETETETCNITFEISQDTRTILNEGKNGYIPELIMIDDSLKIPSAGYCPNLPNNKYKGKTFAFKGSAKTKKVDDLGFEYKNALLLRAATFTTINVHSFKILSVEENYLHNNEVVYSNCETINKEYKKIQQPDNGNSTKGKKTEIFEDKVENNLNSNVAKMPEFPGGNIGSFIAKNIDYPVDAQDLGISGIVIVKFVVNIQGNVENIEIEKSVHPSLDKAAIDVIKKLPKFVPGEDVNGEKIPVHYSFPIEFKM